MAELWIEHLILFEIKILTYLIPIAPRQKHHPKARGVHALPPVPDGYFRHAAQQG
jgi:hypothetical protein